jgi:hypothetical protein
VTSSVTEGHSARRSASHAAADRSCSKLSRMDEGVAFPEVREEPLREARALHVLQIRSPRQCLRYVGGIGDRGQIYEHDTLSKVIGHLGACFDGKPGLAHTRRTGEREEAHLFSAQHLPDHLQITLTAEQSGWLCPKVAFYTHRSGPGERPIYNPLI